MWEASFSPSVRVIRETDASVLADEHSGELLRPRQERIDGSLDRLGDDPGSTGFGERYPVLRLPRARWHSRSRYSGCAARQRRQ